MSMSMKDEMFVVCVIGEDYHSGDVWRDNRMYSYDRLIEWACSFDDSGLTTKEVLSAMGIEELLSYCGELVDSDRHASYMFFTKKQYEKELEDKERREIESTAAWFARQCGHQVGSEAYIIAAHDAINRAEEAYERWNDSEVQAEVWAAVRYGGGSIETYYSDRDFVNNKYYDQLDELNRVLVWLERNCPLLCRQVEQEILKDEEEEEEED